ncbi:MAG: ATP-grasp domain-containing protein [Acidobacteriota bacterium]
MSIGGVDIDKLDVFLLEDLIWVATAPVGLPSYDFSFSTYFACRHPWHRPEQITTVARFGVTTKYEELYNALLDFGIRLLHSPEQYLLASELPRWYPLLSDLTPRSVWFDQPLSASEIEGLFSWPIFIKGSRQTSRHQSSLAIVSSSDEYERVIEHFRNDPILHWQQIVCREYIALRPVPAPVTDKIPPAFEFRTFWWRGQCVGTGPYWSAFSNYSWSDLEEEAALAVAGEAARLIGLPFLVVDVAQTINGDWIVIECNDAHESGYNGVSPIGLWQRVIDIERNRS